MADIKITDLTAYTDPVSTDVVPIVDVGSDVTKKVSIADLLENAGTGTAAAPSFSFDGDNNTGLYQPGADQVAISTGGTEKARVNSNGDVLIGGTLPSSPNISLNADGSATFAGRVDGIRNAAGDYNPTSTDLSNKLFYLKNTDNSTNSSAGLGFSIGVSGTAQGTINLISESGGTAGTFAFQQRTAAGSSRETLRINSTGNVLIGGTLPSSPAIELNANGTATLDGDIQVGGNANNGSQNGSLMRSPGLFQASRPAGSSLYVGYTTGSTSATSVINSDGDATFAGDITCTDNSKGLVLKSPDGTSFRLSVANDGTLSATSI